MASQSRKYRGMRTQAVVAKYLAANGWPFAESAGSGRSGSDVTGTPDLAIEVKARTDFSPFAWLRQAETAATTGRLPVAVVRPNGLGEDAGRYLAMVRLEQLVALLHAAGYGDPTSTDPMTATTRNHNPMSSTTDPGPLTATRMLGDAFRSVSDSPAAAEGTPAAPAPSAPVSGPSGIVAADLAPGTVVEVETRNGHIIPVYVAEDGLRCALHLRAVPWDGERIIRVFTEAKEPTPIRPEDVSREVARVVLTSTDPAVHAAMLAALVRAGVIAEETYVDWCDHEDRDPWDPGQWIKCGQRADHRGEHKDGCSGHHWPRRPDIDPSDKPEPRMRRYATEWSRKPNA